MLPNQITVKLQSLRLNGMLKALEEQSAMPDIGQLSFVDRLGLIVDREDLERRDKSFQGRLRKAQFKDNACIEDVDYSAVRGINKLTILNFASGDWIKSHQNIIITGSTGAGKTYLACALGTGRVPGRVYSQIRANTQVS